MRRKHKTYSVLESALLLICIGVFPAGSLLGDESSRYLDAVRDFADNVLKYGRDTYGPKHTPLFVDGLNIHTHEPVKWIAPNGDRWILSNLASQQNLFRTLDGLTKITGDPKYKQAAMDAIKYAFENLRSPNGLLYWGGHSAYDAGADRPCGRGIHEFKCHYPYYELMWEVDPQATKQFIEAYWSGHILDWSNLDMDRHCYNMTRPLGKPWEYRYENTPVFFRSLSSPMVTAGSDLFYAGVKLYKLSGDRESFVWSKLLASRYSETRNINTGIGAYVYNKGSYYESLVQQFGDDFKNRTGSELLIFPGHIGTGGPEMRQDTIVSFSVSPGIALNMVLGPRICALLLGEILDKDGDYFKEWAFDDLTAWGKTAYCKENNSWIPMFTDGTSLLGYVFTKHGYFGIKGSSIEPIPLIHMDFWGYALAYRVTGDLFMWEMTRDIAKGFDLGDIGDFPGVSPHPNMNTDCWQPYILLGFLELYKKTNNDVFLQMAKRIGLNLIDNRFHHGFFVASKDHTYAKFDSVEALTLLQLYMSINNSEPGPLFQVWPNRSDFSTSYRSKEVGYDNTLIYPLVGISEPPLSLQEAAAEGNIVQVRRLISSGMPVDMRDDAYFRTALHRGAIKGYSSIVELLLASGADPDGRDSYVASALHYAAEKGHEEIVVLLIASGADVDARNALGDTPLQYAAWADNKDIIELLLQKGATIANLHIASYMGDLEKAGAFIKEGVDKNALDGHGYAPLHYAARNNQKEITELLIANGVDINIKNWEGKTPLDLAVSRGHQDIVELLLNKGANANSADNAGNTLLHGAVQNGQKEIAELLIDKGADINVKNKIGRTPLDLAVSRGHQDIVELLLNKGANANSADNAGNTLLHRAVQGDQKEIAELLIDKGADINAKNRGGQTPLDFAVSQGHNEIADLLRKHGAEQ